MLRVQCRLAGKSDQLIVLPGLRVTHPKVCLVEMAIRKLDPLGRFIPIAECGAKPEDSRWASAIPLAFLRRLGHIRMKSSSPTETTPTNVDFHAVACGNPAAGGFWRKSAACPSGCSTPASSPVQPVGSPAEGSWISEQSIGSKEEGARARSCPPRRDCPLVAEMQNEEACSSCTYLFKKGKTPSWPLASNRADLSVWRVPLGQPPNVTRAQSSALSQFMQNVPLLKYIEQL